MKTELRLPLRPCPDDDLTPGGFPLQSLPAGYDEEEMKSMRALRKRLDTANPVHAKNCLCAIHELKVLVGARILSPEEEIELWGESPPAWALEGRR